MPGKALHDLHICSRANEGRDERGSQGVDICLATGSVFVGDACRCQIFPQPEGGTVPKNRGQGENVRLGRLVEQRRRQVSGDVGMRWELRVRAVLGDRGAYLEDGSADFGELDVSRTVPDELAQIQSVDVVLPTADGVVMRVRCVVKPEPPQAMILERLRIDLPRPLRTNELALTGAV